MVLNTAQRRAHPPVKIQLGALCPTLLYPEVCICMLKAAEQLRPGEGALSLLQRVEEIGGPSLQLGQPGPAR